MDSTKPSYARSAPWHAATHGWILLSLILCAGPWSTFALAATEPDTRTWVTDGTVNAVTRFGPVIFLGGEFGYVGPNSGLGVSLDTRNAEVQSNAPRMDGGSSGGGAVLAAASDGVGGWFVGGDFTRAGSLIRQNLAYIRSDRSVDGLFILDTNGPVRALAYDASAQRLYVGGRFTTIGSATRSYVAAINTQTGAVTSWTPNLAASAPDGGVHALTLSADGRRLFVGGAFDSVNGDIAAAGLVALDTEDGAIADGWTPASHTVGGGIVHALALDTDAGILFVGGTFATLGGINRARLGAVNATDGSLQAWDPSANGGDVYALAFDDTPQQLYVGGSFTTIGGQPIARLARISARDHTAISTTWTPNPDAVVHTLTLAKDAFGSAGEIFVGGEFTQIAGVNRPLQAKIVLADGALAETWKPLANGVVRTMTLSTQGDALFVGGSMTSNGGRQRNNLAAVLTATGAPTNWAPLVAGGGVRALTLTADGSRVYIAGNFTSVGNTPREGIARLGTDASDPTTWIPDSWHPDLGTGGVQTLALATLGANVRAVAIHPSNTQITYAGTEKGLFKTVDGGLTWTKLAIGATSEDVRALLIVPDTPSTVYAGTFGSGVLKTTDGGATWVAMNNGLSHLEILSLAILPDKSLLFVGTAAAPGVETGLFTLATGEDTWKSLLTGEMRSIHVDRRDDNFVYVAAPDGIWRWSRKDGRAAFTQIIIGLPERSMRSVVSIIDSFTCNGDVYTVLYASSGAMVYRLSCEKLIDPLTGRPLKDAEGNDRVAATWLARRTGLPASTVSALLVHPNQDAVMYASTLSRGVYKSTDGGTLWAAANADLAVHTVYTITMAPQTPDLLFAGSALGFAYRSSDAAATWQQRSAGIPNDILYVGGDFQAATRSYAAELSTSAIATDYFGNWNAASDGPVRTMLLSADASRLFVGGSFNNIGGAARRNIAVLNTEDASATAFAASVDDGEVRAIALDEPQRTLYLGGTFTSVSGQSRTGIAAVAVADGAVQPWNPNIAALSGTPEVNALLVTNKDNLVYAAGEFATVDGETRTNLAALLTTPDPDTGYVTDWAPNPNAPFPTGQLFAADSRDDGLDLFFGGAFTMLSDLRSPSLGIYRFKPPRVKASPPAQAYNTPQRISLDCVKTEDQLAGGAVVPIEAPDPDCKSIFYTTDSELSTATWQRYTAPIDFSSTIQLSYYATRTEGMRSANTTGRYIFDTTNPGVSASVADGTYAYTQVVYLNCEDGDATDPSVSQCADIYYTTDGTTPTFEVTTDASLLTTTRPTGTTRRYADFVPIILDTNLKFLAVDSAGNASPMEARSFRIERGEGSGAFSVGGLALLAAIGAQLRRRNQRRSNREDNCANHAEGPPLR